MNSDQHGQYTQDSPRNEGRQGAEGEGNLQQQTCADSGGPPRKRDRIVYIENSTNSSKAFIIQEVGTVDEVIRAICEKYPTICIESIGMKVSSSRQGTIHRSYFMDRLPYDVDTLYVTLYLRKHSF
jgi:hypothetical protein